MLKVLTSEHQHRWKQGKKSHNVKFMVLDILLLKLQNCTFSWVVSLQQSVTIRPFDHMFKKYDYFVIFTWMQRALPNVQMQKSRIWHICKFGIIKYFRNFKVNLIFSQNFRVLRKAVLSSYSVLSFWNLHWICVLMKTRWILNQSYLVNN